MDLHVQGLEKSWLFNEYKVNTKYPRVTLVQHYLQPTTVTVQCAALPSIVLLPIVFWPFACCLYLIQQASSYFWSIWSIVYCLFHCPSTHHPFILLYCLYSIQQSPYPGLLLSLPHFGTLFACCQFMLWLLLSFVLHLNRTVPESSWIVQFHPISSSLATSKLILPR